MMGNTLKQKKSFSMPHVYAVILILCCWSRS